MSLSFPFIVISLLFLGLTFCVILLILKRRNALALFRMKRLLLFSHKSERANLEHTSNVLHDKLQGDLIAIKNFLYIYDKLENENDKKEVMSNLKSTLDLSIINTSRLSRQLIPPFLENEGFVKAMEYYFEIQNKFTNVRFSIQKCEMFLVTQEKAYELFRIVEIFCVHAVKECNASNFILVLNGNEIELIDDGDPFLIDMEFQSPQKSIFLSLASRLDLIDGQLKQIVVLKGNRFVLKF